MNLNQLLDIASRANNLQKEDINELVKYSQSFPYFQLPKILLAKYEFERSQGQEKEFLGSAAILCENRTWLKELIENENSWLNFNETFKNHLSAIKSKSSVTNNENFIDDLDDQLIPRPKTEVDPVQKLNVLKKLGKEIHDKKAIESGNSNSELTISPDLTSKEVNEIPESTSIPTRKRRKPANDDLIETIKKREKKEIKDEKKKEQIDIIKAFSKKEIKLATIQEIEANHNQSDLSEKSTKINETLITESYAKLLAKQNKKSKAIEIYQKLIVKFPDKSTYFADQIKNLEE